MTKKYIRLTLHERIEIYKFIALKHSLSQIATALGRHKSTVTREVKRIGRNDYHYLRRRWCIALKAFGYPGTPPSGLPTHGEPRL